MPIKSVQQQFWKCCYEECHYLYAKVNIVIIPGIFFLSNVVRERNLDFQNVWYAIAHKYYLLSDNWPLPSCPVTQLSNCPVT